MYGVIFMIGQAISAVALMIIFVTLFGHFEPLSHVANPRRVQDLGNFLMAFTMFWAYVSVSQLIIIWSNNLPETNMWYAIRLNGFWGWISAILLLFHFATPFLILFSRWVKQKVRALVIIACWMLVMRLVDIFWILVPTFEREVPFSLLDVAVVVGIGGIWLAVFTAQLKNKPLLPLHDPRLAADHG
jgi:phosphoglycerol transferase MdoB-like AlkP superfamily enzyme